MRIRIRSEKKVAMSLLLRVLVLVILLLAVFLVNYAQGSSVQETGLNILFRLDPLDVIPKWKVIQALGLENDPNINPFFDLASDGFQWSDRQQALLAKWRQWLSGWSAPGAANMFAEVESVLLDPVFGFLCLALFGGWIAGYSVTWLEDEIAFRTAESSAVPYRCLRWLLQLGVLVAFDIFMLACVIPLLAWPFLAVITLPLDFLSLLGLWAPWLYPVGALILLCGSIFIALRYFLLKPDNLVLLAFYFGLEVTGVTLQIGVYLLYVILLHIAVRGLNFALEEFDLDDPDTIFERLKTSAVSGGVLFGVACGCAEALRWLQAQL